MKSVLLPSSIRIGLIKSLNDILESIDKLSDEDSEICFEFSEVEWISGEMTTLLGMEMRRLQFTGHILYSTGMSPRIKNILNKNGFNTLLLDHPKAEDIYNTTIPYTEISSNALSDINNYIDSIVFNKLNKTLVHATEQRFKEAVFEIADNTHIHSNSNQIYMYGQHFPQKQSLAFTIADNGISIPVKVNNALHAYTKNVSSHDTDLIDWATKQGNSTKDVPAAGLGLSDIINTMKQLGELTIVSNYGYWKLNSSNTLVKHHLNFPLHGTLIHFNFLLEKNFYTPTDNSAILSF